MGENRHVIALDIVWHMVDTQEIVAVINSYYYRGSILWASSSVCQGSSLIPPSRKAGDKSEV